MNSEKEKREAYEKYIFQMSYRYMDEDDYGGIFAKAKARQEHPYDEYWPGKERYENHWR